MTTSSKLHVQIGQVKIGQNGQKLTAILGSCIGLGLLCPERGLCGLAHCLLGGMGKVPDEPGGRHVEQAVTSLISMMELDPADFRTLKAIVVGGANMTMPADTDPSRLVGAINSGCAYSAVRKLGLRDIHMDTGGTVGRQVTIDCSTCGVEVAEIPRLGGRA